MQRVLITGAAGSVGTLIRPLLAPIYPNIVSSDVKEPPALQANETFIWADLADMESVERVCEGVDGVIHLGGYSVEGPWEDILEANIIGCYNLFEAARRQGVKRVVFASSNHVVGFYPRVRPIGVDVVPRPDSRYGVSKHSVRAYAHSMPTSTGCACFPFESATSERNHSINGVCRFGSVHPTSCSSSGSAWNILISVTRSCTALH